MQTACRRLILVLVLLCALPAQAQDSDSLTITFRFLPDQLSGSPNVARAFLPGQFNDWGQPYAEGTPSCIQEGDASQMQFLPGLLRYRHTVRLPVGERFEYKVQYHTNAAGTACQWISDPLNPRTNPENNNNSVVTVNDPMAFQLVREKDEEGRVVAVSAGLFASREIEELRFTVDGTERDGLPYYAPETDIFHYELEEPLEASISFEITATDAAGNTISKKVGLSPGTVEDAPVPSGIRDGINYYEDDPTKVTLSLFAPRKDFVHVIGDFNDWTPSDEYLMKRDSVGADSIRWWITLEDLSPGTEYDFQYLVDGQFRVADPYAEKVRSPNDRFIEAAAYPNLKDYPASETSQVVSVLQTDQTEYEWQATDFERPAQKDLVIYELLIRDFLDDHDYETLTDTLSYLDRLGVNAIELMPVAEFEGNESWGYNPMFYFAPDKYYGPARDLKRFVDAAHQRGMAVILDVVYNHATGQSPFVRLYNEGSYGPPTEDNPWVNREARHPFNVFYDNNHASTATQYWLDRANRYWLEEFRVDGFRFDLTGGFLQTGDFFGYNAERVGLLKRMMRRIWQHDDHAYVILEHLVVSSREWKELASYGKDQGRAGPLLWHPMNRAYSQSALGYVSDGDLSSNLRPTYPPFWDGGIPVPNAITYMESHDEQWLMYRNIAYGPEQDGYDVSHVPTALQRQELVGAFFLTVPGPRMMWQFGELGYGYGESGEQCLRSDEGECPAEAPPRTGKKPIRWDYRSDPDRAELYNAWAALLHLRNTRELFTSPETEVSMRVGQGVEGRRIRLSGDSMNAVIVGNFGLTPRDVNPKFQHAGTWYNYFSGETRTVTDTEAPVRLQPGHYRVFTDQEVDFPEGKQIATARKQLPNTGAPAALRLRQNYPNPFHHRTRISYTLDRPARVKLTIHDVLGREVAIPVEGRRTAGLHTVNFEATGLPSGTYIYRLEANGRVRTQRMMVVK